jgi:hypothetical protein
VAPKPELKLEVKAVPKLESESKADVKAKPGAQVELKPETKAPKHGN